MTEIRRILVPIDFSTCSKQAIEYAVALSERYCGASIDVLHVWEPSRDEGAPTRVEVMKDMETLLADHEAKGVVKIRRCHESGDTVPVILDFARRGDYDLIVMGTHGRSGTAHDYLGSVAEKIVRRAAVPVLTIREKRPAPAGHPNEKHAGAAS